MARKLPKALDRNDAATLLRGALGGRTLATAPIPAARNYVALTLMLHAGLRSFEVGGLTVADVDLASRFLYVQLGKGGKDRYVPMDAKILYVCREWLKRRPESPWFVCTTKGTPTTTPYLRNMLRRISKANGVFIQDGGTRKPVQPHALRHTWATTAIENGMDLLAVQGILGHTRLSTTSNTYAHVRPKHLREAMDRLPADTFGE